MIKDQILVPVPSHFRGWGGERGRPARLVVSEKMRAVRVGVADINFRAPRRAWRTVNGPRDAVALGWSGWMVRDWSRALR